MNLVRTKENYNFPKVRCLASQRECRSPSLRCRLTPSTPLPFLPPHTKSRLPPRPTKNETSEERRPRKPSLPQRPAVPTGAQRAPPASRPGQLGSRQPRAAWRDRGAPSRAAAGGEAAAPQSALVRPTHGPGLGEPGQGRGRGSDGDSPGLPLPRVRQPWTSRSPRSPRTRRPSARRAHRPEMVSW